MNETKVLVEQIVEGIQNRKGERIVIADLTEIGDTICKYFVICQGNSPTQIAAIVDEVREVTREQLGVTPNGWRWTMPTCWCMCSCPK